MKNQIAADNLSPITHNQTSVITTELLAQLYGAETKNIQQNYSRNAERFCEGKHFFKLKGDELREFKHRLSQSYSAGHEPSQRGSVKIARNVRSLILWTERGAARHAKLLETDQAWEVFEKLEDTYFNKPEYQIEYIEDYDDYKEILNDLRSNPECFIASVDNQLITSSLLVAEAFGKDHKDIIGVIESLDIPETFASANFYTHVQKVSTGNGTQRELDVYRMTKDGLMLLIAGFTGKRAMEVRVAYINAFNRMANQPEPLQPPTNGRITLEQQEALKKLVLSRAKSVAPEHQPRATITLWSALKNHFGRSYKEIDASQYEEALAIAINLPLTDRPKHDARESTDNVMLLTDPGYREQAISYIDGVLQDCQDFAREHNIDMAQWEPVNYELAASGLLADILRHTRAELSFDSHMRPVIKVLPAGALYLSPSSDEAMRGLVSRVVSTETLMAMMTEGLARLDRERKENQQNW